MFIIYHLLRNSCFIDIFQIKVCDIREREIIYLLLKNK